MSKRQAWPSVTIGELIERIEAGVSVRSSDSAATDGEIGVLKTSALSGGRFAPSQNKRILDTELHRAAVSPSAGCTLMSRMNTINLVGESAFIEQEHPRLFLPDRLWQLHPNRELADPYWLSFVLSGSAVRQALQAAASGTSGSMKNITQAQLRAVRVSLPPLALQAEIGRLGRMLVNLNEQFETRIALKSDVKRGLMHELLTGKRCYPKHRKSRMRSARLGDYTRELTERNRGRLGVHSVMGVVKSVGLTPMKEHVRAASIDRYLVVPPNGFAYNPMRLNIGSIARNQRGEECLVSPDYVVFKTDETTLLPAFLDQVRQSHAWQRFVRPAGSGSVRVRIYFNDLAEIRIPLPSVEEQKQITDVLDAVDREISLLEQQRDAYDAQRRAVMQRILSGDINDLDPAA